MADKVWVQNAYRSAIEIIVKDEKSLEDEHFVFGNYKLDRISGRVESDGYTVLEKADYDKLMKQSKSFQKLINNGELIIYTEAPLAAMSDVDRILALQEELRVAKEEIKSLKEENTKLKGAKKSESKSSEKTSDKKSDK